MIRTIYAYSSESHYGTRIADGKIPYLKVGDTKRDAETRVSEQDGTSNPEELVIHNTWKVPFRDYTLHNHLKSKGFHRLRDNREWFECEVTDVSNAINELIHGVARPNAYPMRDEQQACHDKAFDYLMNNGSTFLINAKMRFGKTFTAYQIAKSLGARRVLIMTYKPSVELSWKEDLNFHVDFDGCDFKSARTDFSANNPIKLTGDADMEVLFTSFQDFNEFEKAKWAAAKNYHYDLVIIDEMHYGTKTEKALASLAQLSYDNVLQMSGTPIKALMSGEYLPEQIYTWTYGDEQKRRRVEEEADWATDTYRWLPKMHTYMYSVCDAAKASLQAYADDDEGFTMTKMWGTNDVGNFNDPASVDLFLHQLSGGGTVRKNQSPYRTVGGLDHTLWVLPSSVKSVDALEQALLKHSAFRDYKIINVAGDSVKKIETVLATITQAERDGDRTITITCGRFNTGVTVKPWTGVFMLDDGKSPETYFQTIFRSQSPYKEIGKEDCYVFDFNPQRMLTVVYEYAEVVANDEEKSAEESLREYLEFAPIMDHSGNEPVEVDANTVLDMISETGGYIEQFAKASMFCTSAIDQTIITMLSDIEATEAAVISKTLSDNNVGGGKNYKNDGSIDKTAEKKIKDAIAEIRAKAQTVTKRIPNFLDDRDDTCYHDIIVTLEPDYFYTVTGVTIGEFKYMVDKQFINMTKLNRCIMAFRQTEIV